MITIHSIRNFKNPEQYDHAYTIVRSLKNPIKDAPQVKALSPEYPIFKHYLELRDSGNWNMQTFQSDYVPAFLKQIKNDPEAQRWLDALEKCSKAGQNICLLCFCSDETLCHRSIIAGILAARGCEVHSETGQTFSEYGACR